MSDPDRFALALCQAQLPPGTDFALWNALPESTRAGFRAIAARVLEAQGDPCEPYRAGRAYRVEHGPSADGPPIEVVTAQGWTTWEVHAWAAGWNAAAAEAAEAALLEQVAALTRRADNLLGDLVGAREEKALLEAKFDDEVDAVRALQALYGRLLAAGYGPPEGTPKLEANLWDQDKALDLLLAERDMLKEEVIAARRTLRALEETGQYQP